MIWTEICVRLFGILNFAMKNTVMIEYTKYTQFSPSRERKINLYSERSLAEKESKKEVVKKRRNTVRHHRELWVVPEHL